MFFQKFFAGVAAPMFQEVGNVETIAGLTITVLERDASENITKAKGVEVPVDGTAGYAKECTFVDSDTPDGNSGYFENVGNATSCQFVLLTDTTPAEIALAPNKVIVGGSDGKGYPEDIPSYDSETVISINKKRLYLGTVTNGPFQVGESIAQATSLATAVVTDVGADYIDIGTIVGTFNTTNIVTGGTSGATAVPSILLLSTWLLSEYAAVISAVASNSGIATLVQASIVPTTGKMRYKASTKEIETLSYDGYTSVKVDYLHTLRTSH